MANLSNKIKETVTFDDDKMIIKSTFDGSQMLKDAEYARQHTENAFGSDNKYVGNVDMGLVNIWVKEAGVSWTDTHAVKEIIKRKLMSNEFQDLRVWRGTY